MRLVSAILIAILAFSSPGLSDATDYVRERRVQRQERVHDSLRNVPKVERFPREGGRRTDEFEEDIAFWEMYMQNGSSISMQTKGPVPAPTKSPTPALTKAPVIAPTNAPVKSPTPVPKPIPTAAPVPQTDVPVSAPSVPPSDAPSASPVTSPTGAPASAPTVFPTKAPTTAAPVFPPTEAPVATPSTNPPTNAPVAAPTRSPVARPTERPSIAPVVSPTDLPTKSPVLTPTDLPTASPFAVPTTEAPVVTPVDKTLLEIIEETPSLTTLLTAIGIANATREIPPYIVQELNGTAPLTVFAPTNTAFDAFETALPGYLAMLLTPEFGLNLLSLLEYHVTPVAITTADFPITDLAMIAAGTINVTGTSETGFSAVASTQVVPDANILEPYNIRATNGVLHLVDNVLVPRFVTENLVSGLEFQDAQSDQFSTLLRLIRAAGFEMTLSELEGVTLLAPTNDAIPPETEQFLLAPGNEDILNATVNYLVINQLFNYAATPSPNILLVNTLQGESIIVGLVQDGPEGVIVSYNQATQQGYFPVQYNIVYVIDRILVPGSLSTVVPRSINNIMRDPSIKIEFSFATQQGSGKEGYTVEDSAVKEKATETKPLSVKPLGISHASDIDVTVFVNGHEV